MRIKNLRPNYLSNLRSNWVSAFPLGGGVAPAPGAWTPADITTVGWYDVSDAATITEAGGAVSQLDDKSGNANHATQLVGAEQPIYDAVEPKITCSNQRLVVPSTFWSAAGVTSGAVVFVGRQVGASAGWGDFGNSSNNVHSPFGDGFYYDNFLSTDRPQGPAAKAVPMTNDSIQVRCHDGVTTLNYREDGTDIGNATVAGFSTTLLEGCIGPEAAGTYVHKELVFLPDDNVANIQLVEGYLAWKWGMVENLPSNHPYRYDGTLFGYSQLWTPAEITTAAWYDPADPSTITESGGVVSQLDDKSGNANHWVQATAAQRPTLSDKKLVFGLDDNMDLTTPLGPNYYMFCVGAPRVNTAIRTLLYTSASNQPFVVNNASNNVGVYGASFGAAAGITWAAGELALMGFSSNAQAFQKNGNPVAFAFSPSVDRQATSVGGNSLTNSEGFGDISEMVISNTPVDGADIEKIEGYLAWKWGLEASLPALHPYKSAPPTV